MIENWYFTVKARTEAGDEQEDGDDDFKVHHLIFETVSQKADVESVQVEVVGPTEVNAKVKDLGNGEYFVSYSLTQRGDYTINVTLVRPSLAIAQHSSESFLSRMQNGEHVAGSPYHQKF